MLKQQDAQDAKKKTVVAYDKLGGKHLPASIEAERAVLSALLLDDTHIGRIAEIVAPEDFYHIPHKLVFQAIISLAVQSKRIDLVTLQDELFKQNVLEQIGGVVFLVSLQEDIPMLGLLDQHATLVK